VSSYHVLTRAFGDAYMRRENVRHATLLFCAEGVNVRATGAGRRVDNEYIEGWTEKDLSYSEGCDG
jgi:hypothetical protein